VTIDYSPVDGEGYDGMTAIYSGATCPTIIEFECLNSSFGGDDSDTATFPATGGVTYWFQIGDWGSSGVGGPTTLSLDCTSTGETGACCFLNGACMEQTALDCVTVGGIPQGDGTTCEPNACPQPPANETCSSAMDLGPLPAAVVGETCLASDDDTEFCDVSSPNQAVWYTVVGTGNFMVASTCHPATDFDTKIQVFCNSCSNLTCVVGDDDPPGNAPECEKDGENRKARAEWCSVPGALYYIVVGGFSTDCGSFELTVEEAGDCEDPVGCVSTTGSCCFGECPADTNRDGQVNVDDLVAVILGWGPCPEGCVADVNGDLVINVDDLIEVILAWGACTVNCEELTQLQCQQVDGLWQSGVTCAEAVCPVAPPNDDCLACTPIETLPFLDQVSTVAALPGAPRGTCNAPSATAMESDAWWCFTPTEACLASLTVDVDYDGIIVVHAGVNCGQISELLCIDEPDDPATAVFAAVPGQTYFIQVGDWGNLPGGGATILGFDCLPAGTGACCLPDGSCTLETEPECAELGGAHQGGLTTCDGVTCPPPP
jgi:hypothetical protein